jgi:hypothetical protein
MLPIYSKLLFLFMFKHTIQSLANNEAENFLYCRILVMTSLIQDRPPSQPTFYCESQTDFQLYSLHLPQDFRLQHPELGIQDVYVMIENARAIPAIDDIAAYIDYPLGAQISVVDPPNRRLTANSDENSRAWGVKRILMVRITSLDSQVTLSKEELAGRTLGLGAYRRPNNVIAQMKACSFGKLNITPAEAPSVKDGVVDAFLSRDLREVPFNSLFTDLFSLVMSIFGADYAQKLDFVMFCLPSTARYKDRGLYGAAILRHFASFYNDKVCSALDVVMHELGHNLGLQHSSAMLQEYGDGSCSMGMTYYDTGSCFNGAKNWWLGWYEDRRVELNGNRAWTGKLAAFTDYDETKLGLHVVNVKVGGYFLQYNKVEKFNSGTTSALNVISITTLLPNGMSNLTGTIGFNLPSSVPVYHIPNFDGTNYTMVIEACDKVSGNPDYMTLSVHLNNGIQSSYCRGGKQNQQFPTQFPSSSPSNYHPSMSPSRSPSWKPSKLPSRFPSYSISPTVMPSNLPSIIPTRTPSTLSPSRSRYPSLSNRPSRSISPSSSPSVTKLCEDSKTGTFWVDAGRWKSWRNCDWLSKSVAWKEKLCSRYYDNAARRLCPELCGLCTDRCNDDHQFSAPWNGRVINCEWIASRSSLLPKLCKRKIFAQACKETCDTCSVYDNKVVS